MGQLVKRDKEGEQVLGPGVLLWPWPEAGSLHQHHLTLPLCAAAMESGWDVAG